MLINLTPCIRYNLIFNGFFCSPVLHFALVVAHLAVRLEIFEELQAFAFLLAHGQRMIAGGQRVYRIWILFGCGVKQKLC